MDQQTPCGSGTCQGCCGLVGALDPGFGSLPVRTTGGGRGWGQSTYRQGGLGSALEAEQGPTTAPL